MKTAFYLIVTAFISTFQLASADLMHPGWVDNYVIAFGVWALFIWHLSSKGSRSKA